MGADVSTAGAGQHAEGGSPAPEAGVVDGQLLMGDSLLHRYANFVKLPHTVFALPFALLGVVLASYERSPTVRQVVLVAVAFTAARFVAMGFNRIADRRYDARNPRTAKRELPTGRLSLAAATVAVGAAAATFVASAWLLNPLCFALSPVALVWIVTYSYTKRFTTWSHVWLGLGDGIAGPAGYLAVTGQWSEPWWVLPVLALAITMWVGGFDVFYALQDEAFDRAEGLKSAVVRLGRRRAIFLAKVMHGLTIAALLLFGWTTRFGAVYLVGVMVAGGLLVWEHHLIKPDDLRRLDAAFFRVNGIMSVLVFAFALGDRLL